MRNKASSGAELLRRPQAPFNSSIRINKQGHAGHSLCLACEREINRAQWHSGPDVKPSLPGTLIKLCSFVKPESLLACEGNPSPLSNLTAPQLKGRHRHYWNACCYLINISMALMMENSILNFKGAPSFLPSITELDFGPQNLKFEPAFWHLWPWPYMAIGSLQICSSKDEVILGWGELQSSSWHPNSAEAE